MFRLPPTPSYLRPTSYQALRLLSRRRGFSVAVVATIALVIGINVLVFAAVNAILLKPLPYPHSDQLVRVVENLPADESPTGHPERVVGLSPEVFEEWRQQTRTLSGMAMHLPVAVTLRDRAAFTRLTGWRVSASFLAMFDTPPLLGRMFHDGDDQPGATRVLVLAYDAWVARFGRDPRVVGAPVNLDGHPFTVIGVMPPGFSPLDQITDFWVPLASMPASGGVLRAGVLARLRDNVTLAAAQADADRLCPIVLDVPARPEGDGRGHRIEIVRWKDELVAPVRRPLPLLMAAVTLVLLIAVVNLGNLFTVHAIRQGHDMAVRAALGAPRARLIREILIGHFLLAAIGGVAGTGLAWGGAAIVQRFGAGLGRVDLIGGDRMLPRVHEVAIDGSVLLYALVLVVVMTVACSAGALWRLSRLSSGRALAAPDTSTPAVGRAAPLLISAQVTLTVVLMVSGLLLARSFRNLSHVDPGYDARGVLTFQVVPRDPDETEFRMWGTRQVEVADALVARLRHLPGVSAAGFTSNLPMNEGSYMLSIAGASGAPTPIERGRGVAVSTDYFRAMRMPILAGRDFRDSDAQESTATFIVNQTLARRYFGNADPLGQHVSVWGIAGQIVGIVRDIHATTLDAAPQPQLYMTPFRGQPFLPLLSDGLYVTVRAGNATALVPTIRAAAREVAPEAPVQRIALLDDIVANSLRTDQASAWIVGVMAAGSLTLVAVGLYGLVAYLIAHRTREIAVRLAFGARQRDVRMLVMRGSLMAVCAGLFTGVVVAAAAAPALRGLLFGVGESDAASFVLASTLVVAIALVACVLSARKAVGIEPMTLLRSH